MVSIFLFYSGYGISESIDRKGINYVKTLPKKGLILYIKFQLILLIFLLNNLILGIKINIKKYLLSVIFKANIGNSNWFAFTIICLYIFSYLSFRLINKKKNIIIGIIIMSILCFTYIYFVFNYFYPKKSYSVDNILCFIIGMFYSLLKNYLNKIFMRNDIFYFGSTSIIIIFYYYFYKKRKNIILISLKNCLFCIIIVILTMKIRFKNEFLLFLNTHSYSIYLLQRQVMIIFFRKRYFCNNEFIRFFIMFFIILFESNLFDKYTNFINKIFDNKFNKSKNNVINKNDFKYINEEQNIILN
jgi:peptidoglycan/LPS O-acetylase OafA/YrhL